MFYFFPFFLVYLVFHFFGKYRTEKREREYTIVFCLIGCVYTIRRARQAICNNLTFRGGYTSISVRKMRPWCRANIIKGCFLCVLCRWGYYALCCVMRTWCGPRTRCSLCVDMCVYYCAFVRFVPLSCPFVRVRAIVAYANDDYAAGRIACFTHRAHSSQSLTARARALGPVLCFINSVVSIEQHDIDVNQRIKKNCAQLST